MKTPPAGSASFRALNPDLAKMRLTCEALPVISAFEKAVVIVDNKKRVRQSAKPLMNKLEARFLDYLKAANPRDCDRIRAQAKRYKIGSGAWYKPDFTALSFQWGGVRHVEIAFEVKGPRGMKNQDRGYLALKCAAAAWPEVWFYLVWFEAGRWQQQRILP